MAEPAGGTDAAIGSSTLVAGNSGFLFLSFAASAMMNALPQIFYAAQAGEQRTLWLSAGLFLSALCSLAGNRAAQSDLPLLRSAAVFRGSAAATMLLCLVCVYQRGIPVPLYFLSQLLLAFVMACFLQLLDRQLAAAAGESLRQRNDLLTNLFRFVGILLGPFWFWLYAPGTSGALLGTLLFSGTVVISLLAAGRLVVPQWQAAAAPGSSSRRERLFVVAAIMVYATYALLSASLAYQLSELTGQDANRQAILFIVMIFTAAVLFTAGCLAFAVSLPRGFIVLAPAVIGGAGHLLPVVVATGPWAQVLACVVIGCGYGIFQLVLRDVLSGFALRQASTHFIAWFNNVPNYGSIVGFGLMLAISVFCNLAGYSFASAIAWAVALLALLELALLAGFLLAPQPSTLATSLAR